MDDRNRSTGDVSVFWIVYSAAVPTISTGPLLLLLAATAAIGDLLFGALLAVASMRWATSRPARR